MDSTPEQRAFAILSFGWSEWNSATQRPSPLPPEIKAAPAPKTDEDDND